ncbi:hypothetical protein NE237_017057 [Protea cynaroides]|uniref:BED-type domain-containing protein n=1 Tax=Protea cynaroides TaxID=273540 RepID=A0A9Q0K7B1_9MAGN|nr:hypothetical protein NE237_017057 [Protea cynaroides]
MESNNGTPSHPQEQHMPFVEPDLDVGRDSGDIGTYVCKKMPWSRSAIYWISNWPRAQCTKCKQVFLADLTKNGASALNNHMKNYLMVDLNVVREMVLALIVWNELPLKFVEYKQFRKLMLYVFQIDLDQDSEELFEALGGVFITCYSFSNTHHRHHHHR